MKIFIDCANLKKENLNININIKKIEIVCAQKPQVNKNYDFLNFFI